MMYNVESDITGGGRMCETRMDCYIEGEILVEIGKRVPHTDFSGAKRHLTVLEVRDWTPF
jgi:hypothetical protein